MSNNKNQSKMPDLNQWLTYENDPVLHQKCEIVNIPLNAEDQAVMEKLIAYVKWSQDPELCKNPAVGIAANQIGVSKAMFYIRFRLRPADPYQEYAFINPVILERSQGMTFLSRGEGCLSVKDNDKHPGFVPRNYKIKVKTYDYLQKKEITLNLKAHAAIICQHEYDHLQGKLYHERINKSNPEACEPDWIRF